MTSPIQVTCQFCEKPNWFPEISDKFINCSYCGAPVYNTYQSFSKDDFPIYVTRVRHWVEETNGTNKSGPFPSQARTAIDPVKQDLSTSTDNEVFSLKETIKVLHNENKNLKRFLVESIGHIRENLQRDQAFVQNLENLGLKNSKDNFQRHLLTSEEVKNQKNTSIVPRLSNYENHDPYPNPAVFMPADKLEISRNIPNWLSEYNQLTAPDDKRSFREKYVTQRLTAPQTSLEDDWVARENVHAKFKPVAEGSTSSYWHIHDSSLNKDFLVLDRERFILNSSSRLSVAVCYNFNTYDEEESSRFNDAEYILKEYKVVYPAEISPAEDTNEWKLCERGRIDFQRKPED